MPMGGMSAKCFRETGEAVIGLDTHFPFTLIAELCEWIMTVINAYAFHGCEIIRSYLFPHQGVCLKDSLR